MAGAYPHIGLILIGIAVPGSKRQVAAGYPSPRPFHFPLSTDCLAILVGLCLGFSQPEVEQPVSRVFNSRNVVMMLHRFPPV
tara:strand:- start:1804 stop:2049 length:246 start_codon:yes stop_codon:yes gene_type:complete